MCSRWNKLLLVCLVTMLPLPALSRQGARLPQPLEDPQKQETQQNQEDPQNQEIPQPQTLPQEPDTVANLSLERSVIVGRLQKPVVVNSRGVSGEVNMGHIATVPSLLGNSDPIRFVRLLPSVQLNTEMEGGIYMQGSDPAHTLVAQQGVPLYGVSHLLGLFSVFNAPHFKGMRYDTSAGEDLRLGGVIDMELPDTLSRKVGGELSLGLMSAQGTLRLPTGKKSTLTVSARRTFLNLVYGDLIRYDNEPMYYGFTDANLTWMWKPSSRDCIWVDMFGSLDEGSIRGGLVEDATASWYNALGAVHWNHYYSTGTLKQSAYFSTFGLDPHAKAFGVYGRMESYIRNYGYRASYRWQDWNFGAQLSYYHVQPQNPYTEGFHNDDAFSQVPVQNGLEGRLNASYSCNLGYWMQLKAGVGVNGYLSPEHKFFWGINPELKLTANLMDAGKLDLNYSMRHQNLFNVGITNMGLPCEFWILAGDLQAPQRSHNISLAYNVDLFDHALSLSAETYYRQLYNQLEYVGSLMDLYNGSYSLENSVARGRGRAYGVNLMAQKQRGKFTGWISYAFSRSLRTFEGDCDAQEHPYAHERQHELDVVATYDFGPVDVGGAFVLSSGTPFSKPESMYVIGNRIMCEYGPYNGARLPAYVKLDLSVNWYFLNKGGQKAGLNFSMYNVLGRVNAVGYGLHRNKEENAYMFDYLKMNLRFLPSIAVFWKF